MLLNKARLGFRRCALVEALRLQRDRLVERDENEDRSCS